jgi:cobalt-zinc-cadmium efflux system outer membrane protein
MYFKLIIRFIVIFCAVGLQTRATEILPADTVNRTLDDAEKLFLQSSFQLLAAKYEMSAADAAIIQAKLYPNPNLSIDQGAYNSNNKKWFDISKSGETAASLQQLIILAGKRNKQINIAKLNSQITSYQFYDLIRTLKYSLRSSFYSLYFITKSISVYDNEINSLKSLIDAYNVQYKKGNVAFKEIARLQSLQFGLENERIGLLKDAADKQSDIILLTGDTVARAIRPIFNDGIISRLDSFNYSYQQLLDSAETNRYDLLAAKTGMQISESNLSLQKALRIPDVTLGANWDRQGSYITNYNSLSLAFDLPFWNRNQGNIKAAAAHVDESKVIAAQADLQVKNDLNKAFNQFIMTRSLYQNSTGNFNSDYDRLFSGIMLAYKEHTISLLEFIDYYETYKESIVAFNNLQNNLLDSAEELNLATGSSVIK